MKCRICKKTIGSRETRTYVHLYRGETARKVYACSSTKCQEAFDNWIDSLPTDKHGRPLEKHP